MIEVSKRIELDAGHRVPDHQSKCAMPHGHRYAVEAVVTGRVVDEDGDPENGMVVDFSVLKALLTEYVHDAWDHRFLIAASDRMMLRAFAEVPGAVILPLVPTAENLAFIVAQRLIPGVAAWCEELTLARVTVWETPTCSATWTP